MKTIYELAFLFFLLNRTNLPKETMAFPGFPFPSHLPSFINHQDVANYLVDYADSNQLKRFIKVYKIKLE